MKKLFFLFFLFLMPVVGAVSNENYTIHTQQTLGGIILNNTEFLIVADVTGSASIISNENYTVFLEYSFGQEYIEIPLPPSPEGVVEVSGAGGIIVYNLSTLPVTVVNGTITEVRIADCYGGERMLFQDFNYCNYCANGIIFLKDRRFVCKTCKIGQYFSGVHNQCVDLHVFNKIKVAGVWFAGETNVFGLVNVSSFFKVFVKQNDIVIASFNSSVAELVKNGSYVITFLAKNYREGRHDLLLMDNSYVENYYVDVIDRQPTFTYTPCSESVVFFVNNTDLCNYCRNGAIGLNVLTGQHYCYQCSEGMRFDLRLKSCVFNTKQVRQPNIFVVWLDSKADWLGSGNRLLGYGVIGLGLVLVSLILYFSFRKKKNDVSPP